MRGPRLLAGVALAGCLAGCGDYATSSAIVRGPRLLAGVALVYAWPDAGIHYYATNPDRVHGAAWEHGCERRCLY